MVSESQSLDLKLDPPKSPEPIPPVSRAKTIITDPSPEIADQLMQVYNNLLSTPGNTVDVTREGKLLKQCKEELAKLAEETKENLRQTNTVSEENEVRPQEESVEQADPDLEKSRDSRELKFIESRVDMVMDHLRKYGNTLRPDSKFTVRHILNTLNSFDFFKDNKQFEDPNIRTLIKDRLVKRMHDIKRLKSITVNGEGLMELADVGQLELFNNVWHKDDNITLTDSTYQEGNVIFISDEEVNTALRMPPTENMNHFGYHDLSTGCIVLSDSVLERAEEGDEKLQYTIMAKLIHEGVHHMRFDKRAELTDHLGESIGGIIEEGVAVRSEELGMRQLGFGMDIYDYEKTNSWKYVLAGNMLEKVWDDMLDKCGDEKGTQLYHEFLRGDHIGIVRELGEGDEAVGWEKLSEYFKEFHPDNSSENQSRQQERTEF